MKNENKDRRYKLIIALIVIIPVLIALSYAYFTQTENNTEINTGGKISDTFDIDLVTASDGYINASNIELIKPAEVAEKSEKGQFKVVTGNNEHYVNYTLSLTNLSVSANLQVADFKWQLVCLSDITKSASGTFLGINTSTMTIKEDIIIDANSEDTFELRIWIEETDYDQISLMNGTFSGKVTITAGMVYNPVPTD